MGEAKITKEMSIGEVMEKYPSTEVVFKKYFGSGCFTCPGAKMEDIAFGATMHGVDADTVVKELNEAAEGAGGAEEAGGASEEAEGTEGAEGAEGGGS